MKKMSTQKSKGGDSGKVVVPSEKTLNILKQFARAYYVEKALPKAMNGLCVN